MTNSNLTSIDIDIAWDWYESGNAQIEFDELGIQMDLIELEGPAGGNPFVKLTATKTELKHWLLECLGLEMDDLNEFYSNVLED